MDTTRRMWSGLLLLALLILSFSGGGCGGKDHPTQATPPPKAEASATIGPAGGTIEVTDSSSVLYGTKLEIPATALTESQVISIFANVMQPQASSGIRLLSPVVTLRPYGLRLAKSMTITLTYHNSGQDPDSLVRPFQYSVTRSFWYASQVSGSDPQRGIVEIITEELTDVFLGTSSRTFPESYDSGWQLHVHSFCVVNESGRGGGMVGFSQWFYNNHKECYNLFSVDTAASREIALMAQARTSDVTENDFRKNWTRFYSDVQRNMVDGDSPAIIAVITRHAGLPDPSYSFHALLAYSYNRGAITVYNPNADPTSPAGGDPLDQAAYNADADVCYRALAPDQLYNAADFATIFENKHSPLCTCRNIAGSWYATDNGTITITAGGESETEPISGQGTVIIAQNECNVSMTPPGSTEIRNGSISDATVTVTGRSIVSIPDGVSVTQNSYISTGTLSQDRRTLTLNGRILVRGTYQGIPFTATGTDVAVLTRTGTAGYAPHAAMR